MSAEIPVPSRRPRLGGCLLRIAIGALALTAIVIAIGYTFDQGDNADQPTNGYLAGAIDAYPPATVNYIESQHLFITRLPNGDFIALYDKSARQQELHGDCRIHFEDTAAIGTLVPIPNMTGAFVEDCTSTRSVWRPDGVRAFGASYGDLDRFNTSTDNKGRLIVETASRSCTRSRGVIGLEPFDVVRCGTGD